MLLTLMEVFDLLNEGGAVTHVDWPANEWIWLDEDGYIRDEGMDYITLNVECDRPMWREKQLTYHEEQLMIEFSDHAPTTKVTTEVTTEVDNTPGIAV